MKFGIDDAMVLAQQFVAGIFGNLAKFIVDVSDAAFGVGDDDNGMRVHRRLQIVQFLERSIWPEASAPPAETRPRSIVFNFLTNSSRLICE